MSRSHSLALSLVHRGCTGDGVAGTGTLTQPPTGACGVVRTAAPTSDLVSALTGVGVELGVDVSSETLSADESSSSSSSSMKPGSQPPLLDVLVGTGVGVLALVPVLVVAVVAVPPMPSLPLHADGAVLNQPFDAEPRSVAIG